MPDNIDRLSTKGYPISRFTIQCQRLVESSVKPTHLVIYIHYSRAYEKNIGAGLRTRSAPQVFFNNECFHSSLVQLAARLTLTQKVPGSTPGGGSKIFDDAINSIYNTLALMLPHPLMVRERTLNPSIYVQVVVGHPKLMLL
jgi:hypothetical protein